MRIELPEQGGGQDARRTAAGDGALLDSHFCKNGQKWVPPVKIPGGSTYLAIVSFDDEPSFAFSTATQS